MPSYQYINNSGGFSTINANTANEALSSAQDRQSGSGVQLLPTAQGTPAPATIQQSPAVITSGALQPQPTLTVPQANPAIAPAATTVPTPAEALLKNFDLTQNEQAATSAQENIVARMLENITNQQGESAYKTQLLNESGIGQKRQELVNLNSQILQKQAEIQQDDIKLVSTLRAEENRDTLLPFAQNAQAKLAGDAAIIRALKTSEIGVLNALAIGKQGDLQLAKDTINEAVDAKFAPYKEQNALYEAQLKAIQPFLDKAEKKQALAQQTKLNLAMKEIDKVADYQKMVLSNASLAEAPISVINAINKATSIDEIAKAGKGYLVSPADKLDLELKRAQINSANRANQEGKTPTIKTINGTDYQWDGSKWIVPAIQSNTPSGADVTTVKNFDEIKKIQKLSKDNLAINASAGTIQRNPGIINRNRIADWRANTNTILSKLTVTELARIKGTGVTFGALSEGERNAVAAAASVLNEAKIYTGSGENKEWTGRFSISEDLVRESLGEIEKYAEIDFIKRTGMTSTDYAAKQYLDSTEAVLQASGNEYSLYNTTQ
jgi:hypothetical protein